MNDRTETRTPEQILRSKLGWGVIGIFALLLLTVVFDAPSTTNRVINSINSSTNIGLPTVPEREFRLGLDLQGGAQLIYQADIAQIPTGEGAAAVEGVRDVIERRVNGLGVGEAVIQTAKVGENYRINVELPGVSDIEQAIAMIGETPILEFKEENTDPPRELTVEELEQLDEFNAAARTGAEDARERILAGEDLAAVAAEVSTDQSTATNGGSLGFITEFQIPEYYEWAATAAEGDLSPVIEIDQGYGVVRRGASQEGELEVEASHILVCYQGSVNCASIYTKEEARQLAAELFDRVNASNFADLAIEFSTDLATAENGGDLGYFKRGLMIAAFEDAVFGAEVGQIIGPVETDFGYHIIFKQDERTQPEYEFSHVFLGTISEADILPSNDEWKSTALSGAQLDRAEVVTDPQTGQTQVSLQFNAEGRELFRELTERHVGDPIAIFLDGEPISVPVVNQVIPNGTAVISGNFSVREAQLLAQRLNAGALPVPVELIGQQTIGASLGQLSLDDSLRAGLIALIIVGIFMILYYRIPGILAVLALTLYISLTLSLFKFIGVTLSLAGIAGFILSIGMAVDANVLIYERLKEELKKGRALKNAVEDAFYRAWPSIRDGNISTLITCFLLMWFGSSFVQGFALTLGLGVLVSMFSAITVSRVFLRYIAPWFTDKVRPFFIGGSRTNS